MIIQRAHRSKNQRDNQVVTNWEYTEEPSPAFKRLMMLLLSPRDNQVEDTGKEDNIANSS